MFQKWTSRKKLLWRAFLCCLCPRKEGKPSKSFKLNQLRNLWTSLNMFLLLWSWDKLFFDRILENKSILGYFLRPDEQLSKVSEICFCAMCTWSIWSIETKMPFETMILQNLTSFQFVALVGIRNKSISELMILNMNIWPDNWAWVYCVKEG